MIEYELLSIYLAISFKEALFLAKFAAMLLERCHKLDSLKLWLKIVESRGKQDLVVVNLDRYPNS